MHLLLTLADEDTFKDSSTIDETVCANIPDSNFYKKLYDFVERHMIHAPCGKACYYIRGRDASQTASCNRYSRSYYR